MRFRMSLLLVSMMGLGCGESGSDEKSVTDASSNAGQMGGDAGGPDASAGANPDASQACDREMIKKELDRYAGAMPTFSQADADRCADLCKDQSEDCYSEENCPGLELWEACLNRNAFACSASEGKACRAQYEAVECCGTAAACSDLSCVEQKCPTEFNALRDCRTADTACRDSASAACFGPGAVGADGGA